MANGLKFWLTRGGTPSGWSEALFQLEQPTLKDKNVKAHSKGQTNLKSQFKTKINIRLFVQ